MAKAKATKKAKADTSGFTAEERAAMKARAAELKAEARAKKGKADGEKEILAAIAAMPEPDRTMAKRLHALVLATAPMLVPRTWYGMPAYAKDGEVICFFQAASKFKARYATFGFSDKAKLDEGDMWATSFGLKAVDAAVEAKLRMLVEKAVR